MDIEIALSELKTEKSKLEEEINKFITDKLDEFESRYSVVTNCTIAIDNTCVPRGAYADSVRTKISIKV